MQRQKESEYHKEWEKQEDSVCLIVRVVVFIVLTRLNCRFYLIVPTETSQIALEDPYRRRPCKTHRSTSQVYQLRR